MFVLVLVRTSLRALAKVHVAGFLRINLLLLHACAQWYACAL